ncbi:ribosome assembly factor SBDS [Candidatus Woesearchaeota archaeon]|nr:ribosome assembly factor SBDS [Candidatus Woesearchaeota archaeon]
MVSVDEAVIAKLKLKEGTKIQRHVGMEFEILVDCEKAMEFKQGRKVDINDVLAVTDIFTNVKQGDKAPDNVLKEIFGTADSNKIAAIILRDGSIQLTTDYKSKIREEKKKKIIALIAKEGIDPRTKAPLPPKRIELAMQQVKVNIDEFKKPEEQIAGIVDQLRPILPISFEKKTLSISIPAKFGSQAYGILKRFGGIKKEDWLANGSLSATLEVSAGSQEELFDELNKLTHGDVLIKEM